MTDDLDSALAPPGYAGPRSEAGTAEPPEGSGGAGRRSVPSLDPEKIRAAARRALKRIEYVDSGCMIWRGARNSAGTPVLGLTSKRTMPVSRAFWFVHYGELPTGHLERTCRDTRCVNVDHLRPRTSWADEDRFWTRVNVDGPVHPTDLTLGRCWDWVGPLHPSGYGNVNTPHDGGNYAHRHSFFLTHGRLPAPGMHVMHSCDRPCCVNPAHLREGTPAENVADRDERFYGRKKAS